MKIKIVREEKMLDIKLRLYESNDIRSVLMMFKESISNTCFNDYSKEEVNAWMNCFDIDKLNERFLNTFSLVATVNGLIVGFGNIDIKNSYLDCLYVDSKFQRKGVASLICDELEKRCDKPIKVHASKSAITFFVSRGYEIVSENIVERCGVLMTNFALIKY